MPQLVTPEEALHIILAAAPNALTEINTFTKQVFHTRGGRIGSGMGLLLEGLWGYYIHQFISEESG